MAIAIVIVGILLVGLIVGATINFVALFISIPVALLFIGLVVGREAIDRQSRILRMKRWRRSARARKVDFTPVDKRTVI